MVANKPLLGIQPKGLLRVWYWNGEDPKEEVDRRLMATALQYGLTPYDLGDRLFADTGRETPIVVAVQTRDGTNVAVPVINDVIRTISENRIDAMMVDPFVSSHRVFENDNGAIDFVANQWAQIADVTKCAIDLSHHSRKTGGQEVGVEDGRGASALLAAARSGRVLNTMTKEEADKAGIETKQRKYFFRVDYGKTSMTPPSELSEWHRFTSVDLGNGDSVGVPTRWEWPTPSPV